MTPSRSEMTRSCSDMRREILARGPLGPAVRGHLVSCVPCRLFAARLAIVDDALDADSARAAEAAVPAALRARILAAAFPAVRMVSAAPRARALDIALRFAAVAAVVVAAIAVVPGAAQADEMQLRDVLPFAGSMSAPLDLTSIPSAILPAAFDGRSILLRAGDAPLSFDIGSSAVPLAAAAITLLLGGVLMRRR